MPSLRDTISRNKSLLRDPSGQLVDTPTEEVQSLADKAGLASPPVTPIGGAMIGANADQIKMLGTPAQKNAAISIAQQPQQSLQDVMRRQQPRAEASAAEQQKIQKSQNLQNLGGLGDRVNDLINSQKKQLDQQQAHLQVGNEQQTAGGEAVSAENAPEVQSILGQLAADPSNMELQLQLNNALGYDVGRQLSPEEIQGMYQDVTQSIGKSGAEALSNNVTVNDLVAQGGLGYDTAQLSDLLGIPPEEVAGLTVDQLHNKINEITTQEFGQATKLEQKAGSTELGQAERGLARQAGREASATGIRATEADMASLNDQIAKAGTVSFGGKAMSIEEALSDDNISNTVADYLNAAPDSPLRKQLEQSEPDLVNFINKNEAALHDASNAVGKGAQAFQQIQKTNREMVDQVIPQDLVDRLLPDMGKLTSAVIDPKSMPVLAAAQGLGPDQLIQYKQNMSQLAAIPGATEELAGLNTDQIKALGMDNPNGLWNQYKNRKQILSDKEARLNATEGDPDAIVHELFGGTNDSGYSQMQKQYEADHNANILGLPNAESEYGQIDADGDGRLDSPEQLLQHMHDSANQSYSIADALSGKKPTDSTLKPPSNPSRDWDEQQNRIYDKLGRATKDGHITEDELVSSKLDWDDMYFGLKSNSPGFADNRKDLIGALADVSLATVKHDYDLDTPDGRAEARKEIEKRKGRVLKKMIQEGMPAEDAQWRVDRAFNQVSGSVPEEPPPPVENNASFDKWAQARNIAGTVGSFGGTQVHEASKAIVNKAGGTLNPLDYITGKNTLQHTAGTAIGNTRDTIAGRLGEKNEVANQIVSGKVPKKELLKAASGGVSTTKPGGTTGAVARKLGL